MLRDSNEIRHEVLKEDRNQQGKRVREREKRKQLEETASERDDAAVAARIKRALPKPSALTMGAPTAFVTTAAAAAINLCNSLHSRAFQLKFRAQSERERWKHQVANASLDVLRTLVAQLESYVLPSMWAFSYEPEVRGRLLAALAEATGPGIHQIVTLIAQNICPSIFKYLTPSVKPPRRQQLNPSAVRVRMLQRGVGGRAKKPVNQISDTGQIVKRFDSLTSAAASVGMRPCNLYNVIKNNLIIKSCRWQYAKETPGPGDK
jgi:hypothetical protein